ncbi:unnamed protein product [Ranitomeya imitator]|uniref:Endonuclease/exonuclease/phosphatase domain-containing protein n=1 Tax=Ranitomeya imitator TaxID=111125 RepID=A0ABN9LD53_9NEOB|nr:unnamed protein product [Ranitomeya imitator]
MVKNTIAFKLIAQNNDPTGRCLTITCLLNGELHTLTNLYAPNEGQHKFLRTTLHEVSENVKGSNIICGDFNLPMHVDLDCSSGSRRPRGDLTLLTGEFHLHDYWRYSHASERDYTFYSSRHSTFATLSRCRSATIGLITWSDHAPITLSLTLAHQANPAFRWRLNDALLLNGEVLDRISSELEHYFQINDNGEVSDESLWLAHKVVIRGVLLQQASYLKRKRESGREALLSHLQYLDNINKSAPTPSISEEIYQIRFKLRENLLARYAHNMKKSRLIYMPQM